MTPAIEDQVWALEEARRQAMLAHDVAALGRLVSDALIYTHSSGGRDSKASWLAKVADGTMQYDTLDFTEPGITVLGDTALIAARMHAAVRRAGQPGIVSSLYLAVWVRQGTDWQLAAIQATPVPPKG